MRIIFLGTASDSAQILESLIENNKNVVMVITNPTRIGNRKKLNVPAVKTLAESKNIFCYQTDNVSSEQSIELIKKYKPDLFITASFSQFLKQNFLSLAPTINVHPSLLPKYRGATPIQSAILNGEKITGISILKTEFKMDAGDIILQKKEQIFENETSAELANRLWTIAKKMIIDVVDMFEKNKIVFCKQNESEATFCKTFKKEEAKLNFNNSAQILKHQILAYNPWPISFCYFENKLVKIYRAEVEHNSDYLNLFKANKIGEVVSTKNDIYVLCGENSILKINELQVEGGKCLNTITFLNGRALNGVFN